MAPGEHHRKIATAWATQTLLLAGATLYFAPGGAWDIETPNGWRTAETWQDLCSVARTVRAEQTGALAAKAGDR